MFRAGFIPMCRSSPNKLQCVGWNERKRGTRSSGAAHWAVLNSPWQQQSYIIGGIRHNKLGPAIVIRISSLFGDNKKYLDAHQSRPLNNHLSLRVNKLFLRSPSLWKACSAVQVQCHQKVSVWRVRVPTVTACCHLATDGKSNSGDSLCETRTSSATFHTPEVTKQSWKLKWPERERGGGGRGECVRADCIYQNMYKNDLIWTHTHARTRTLSWKTCLEKLDILSLSSSGIMC